MPEFITAKINVTKILKEKMFRGRDGVYLDIALIPNRNGTDQYGNDWMVVQSVPKEDRDRGMKGPILGNAKIQRRAAHKTEKPESRASNSSNSQSSKEPF